MSYYKIKYSYPKVLQLDRYCSPSSSPDLPLEAENKTSRNLVLINDLGGQNDNIDFIKKVLSAIDINSPEEYSIIYTEQSPSWINIKNIFPELKLLIAFGFTPHELGLQTHNSFNQWIYLEDQQLIFTQSPEKLIPDPTLKMQLWNQLKIYTQK